MSEIDRERWAEEMEAVRREADRAAGLQHPGVTAERLREPSWLAYQEARERLTAEDPAYAKAMTKVTKLEYAIEQDRLAEHLRNAGIPRRYIPQLVKGDMDATDAVMAARAFCVAASDLATLVLAGPIGCGKTFGACVVAEAFARRGESLLFTSAQHVATMSDFDAETRGELEGVGLLVVDDLGAEYDRGGFTARLDDLLSRRYHHERHTVITANLSGEEFTHKYGERLASRVHQVGRFVALVGKDLRRGNQR